MDVERLLAATTENPIELMKALAAPALTRALATHR